MCKRLAASMVYMSDVDGTARRKHKINDLLLFVLLATGEGLAGGAVNTI